MTPDTAEIAIVGAGIAGIATAYYLVERHGLSNIALVDAGQPMGLTSAQSGENYRNWWPHRVMTDFTDASIDLMERIARDSGNRLRMTRRGYALATRRGEIDDLMAGLHDGYGDQAESLIRVHASGSASRYVEAVSAGWEGAPGGVDVLRDRDLIGRAFPWYDREVATVLHIRRAGDISGQQMGQHMLERVRAAGGRRVQGRVEAIGRGADFEIDISGGEGRTRLVAARLVDAAGPFVQDIAAMIGVDLPLRNVLQQKLAFEDVEQAIARTMPFSIDLDGQQIDWSDEERELLADDPDLGRLARSMPGGIHCRPDGGDRGTWVKLGWAFNDAPSAAEWNPALDDRFPEIVLRGAARLNPSLRRYYGRLPRNRRHYGGLYTMTEENWPLIGPMGPDGAFVVGALSGFGTMAACAAGALCADWTAGAALPGYAHALSLDRYRDAALMAELAAVQTKGVL